MLELNSFVTIQHLYRMLSSMAYSIITKLNSITVNRVSVDGRLFFCYYSLDKGMQRDSGGEIWEKQLQISSEFKS